MFEAAKNFDRDGGFDQAATISYFALLSILPLSILLIALGAAVIGSVDVAERGLELRTISAPSPHSHLNVISVRGGGRSIGGTVSMTHGGSRIIEVDGHSLDIRPSPHMLFVRNDDTPGMVGTVGAALGDAGINISNMHIGQTAEGVAALMVIATTSEVPTAVQEKLRTHTNVLTVRAIDLY